MARTARKHSDTGVYHAILRGVNKQQIFECTEDYQRFLNILCAQALQERDEAGNRSKDECLPEETNRRIVDIISDVNLAYSEHARKYLHEWLYHGYDESRNHP